MSLVTPTTQSLADNIIAQLEAALNQTIPLLPKSFNRVLAKVLAGVLVLLYKYDGFIFQQMFVQSAVNQDINVLGVIINPLKFWGRLIGVGDPTAGTNAELLVDVTVENQVGSLGSGVQMLNSNNGVTYITLGSTLLNAPVVQVTVKAVQDQNDNGGVGAIGNLDPGAPISFANTPANVARDAIVDSQVVTGADEESTEVYRQRIIDRFQKRIQGGAYADYQVWAEEVAGIINGYPYTGLPGQVDVYSEATVASSGNVDGIPTVAQLEAVLDNINLSMSGLASHRNANAFVNSLPITRVGFDVKVTGIIGVDDIGQVQTDINTGITEYFLASEPFIVGLSILPRVDILTATRVAAIVEDIVTAAGGTFTLAQFFFAGGAAPLVNYVLGEGEKSKLANPVVFV